MKKLITQFRNTTIYFVIKHAIVLLVLILVFAESQAQRRIVVPEGYGTLNQVIDGDTIAGGVRTNPNTIYVLKRGGVYLLSGSVINVGYHLTLEAEEGNGPRPYVMLGLLTVQLDQTFSISGDLTLRSIHTTSLTEGNSLTNRIITIGSAPAGAPIRVNLTDCILDRAGQSLFRVTSNGARIYVRNSTISRIGLPNNPDNGRVIDNRTVVVDSLVLENNTIYDITSTLVRDGGIGTGPNDTFGGLKYGLINQNTIVNLAQRLGAFGVFFTSSTLSFTNNIVISHRFQGNTASSTNTTIEFTVKAANTPTIEFKNNNFSYQNQVQQTWAEPEVSLVMPLLQTPENASYFSANISQSIPFSGNIPAPPLEIIRKFALGQTSTAPEWDWTGAVQSVPWELTALSYHNFAYPSSAPSYTASTTSEPLGDLRWHTGFEVSANLHDLVKRANAEVTRQQVSEVVGSDPTKLAALQAAIANSQALLQTPGITNAQIGAAHAALKIAFQEFKDSFIITDVEEDLTRKIRFYPNPAPTYIYVPNPENNKIKSIRVLSLTGQGLKQLHVGMSELITVSVGDLPNGTYIILFELSNNQRVIQKLVKANN